MLTGLSEPAVPRQEPALAQARAICQGEPRFLRHAPDHHERIVGEYGSLPKVFGVGQSNLPVCPGPAPMLAPSRDHRHASHQNAVLEATIENVAPVRIGARHLHRRPARARQAARAAHVLRLRRLRLVDREHLPRQRDRLPARSSCASASPSTWRTARSRTTMVGQPVACRSRSRPTGLTGMQHADGEILAARAAAASPACRSRSRP